MMPTIVEYPAMIFDHGVSAGSQAQSRHADELLRYVQSLRDVCRKLSQIFQRQHLSMSCV